MKHLCAWAQPNLPVAKGVRINDSVGATKVHPFHPEHPITRPGVYTSIHNKKNTYTHIDDQHLDFGFNMFQPNLKNINEIGDLSFPKSG